MKKRILLTILLLLTFVVGATGQTINELPLYGGVEKTESQKKADKKFVNAVIKSMGSGEKAARHFVKRGWEALSKGDSKTAIKRFNQAWLVFPENGKIYWGLALTQAQQGEFNLAIDLYEEADQLLSDNARFLADYGYTIIGYADDLKNNNMEYIDILDEGIDKLNTARDLEPKLSPVYFYLAVAEFNRENYKEAWENVYLAEKLGNN
nr:tetratricopeptide repeat protein [Desulfocapsaceae bacterium]